MESNPRRQTWIAIEAVAQTLGISITTVKDKLRPSAGTPLRGNGRPGGKPHTHVRADSLDAYLAQQNPRKRSRRPRGRPGQRGDLGVNFHCPRCTICVPEAGQLCAQCQRETSGHDEPDAWRAIHLELMPGLQPGGPGTRIYGGTYA